MSMIIPQNNNSFADNVRGKGKVGRFGCTASRQRRHCFAPPPRPPATKRPNGADQLYQRPTRYAASPKSATLTDEPTSSILDTRRPSSPLTQSHAV